MTPSGGVAARKGDNQALGGAWFYVLEADDVRGDKLLLLGGVANKITAHTPASKTDSVYFEIEIQVTRRRIRLELGLGLSLVQIPLEGAVALPRGLVRCNPT